MRSDGTGGAKAPERPPIRRYEDIEAYQRAMHLLRPLHRIVRNFPVHETYELASQLRRASKSIPMIIAEAYAKKRSPREFKHYLSTALGSVNEVTIGVRTARQLGYMKQAVADRLEAEYAIAGKQLNRLMQAWR